MGQKFIKVDNYFGKKSRYKGGPLSHEANFQQDANLRSLYSGEDVIYGMGGLIRT